MLIKKARTGTCYSCNTREGVYEISVIRDGGWGDTRNTLLLCKTCAVALAEKILKEFTEVK